MRNFLCIYLLLFAALPVHAQKSKKEKREENRQRVDSLLRHEEEGFIAYHKQTVFSAKLTSDGYGGLIEIGRIKSVKKSILYQLEINERKHQKEEKITNPNSSSLPFIFGKQNFVYNVKLGAQEQFVLGNKNNKNGVSVTANVGGGICIGLLRPYYVEVKDTSTNAPSPTKFIRYTQADSSRFMDVNQILGGPSFGKGWSNLSVVPGIYVKAGLRFDYGRLNEMVNALEVGISADIYTKKIAQMVGLQQHQAFFNLYVAFMMGKRK